MPAVPWEARFGKELAVLRQSLRYADTLGDANLKLFSLGATLAGFAVIFLAGLYGRMFIPLVETFFVPTSPQWSYLSSSLIKEVVRFGGDVSGLVPAFVAERLEEKLGTARE